MPIQTQSADGVTHEFPDGTAPDVVDRTMKSYADEHKDKSTALGEVGTGIMDPIEGGGQLIADLMPARAERAMNEANNWLAERSGGLIRKLPEGGKNEQMQRREQEITARRGGDTSIDWNRMAGNILSPVNFLGAGLVRGAGVGANIARGAAMGATSGAIQPATDPDFWTEKGIQTAVGGLVGSAAGAVGEFASDMTKKIGEYVARNYPENLQSNAVQKVLRRLQQDEKAGGPSAADMIDLINESGKPVSLADVGSTNTKALAGNVARKPGEARQTAEQFLTKRDEDAAARLSQDIGKYVSGGKTAFQATEALLQARSAAAKPAYEAAHALEGVWSPRLEQFLQDPLMKSGLQRGYEIERLQSLANGEPLTATQMGVDMGVDGSVRLLDKPNMRLLDMGKQGLDAMIADERNEITGRLSARGVALEKVRRAYVETIDDLDKTGAYKKARASWAGHSQSLDAIRMGRTTLQRSGEENEGEIAKMSPANREFYRLGLADLLKERLAKAGLNADEAKQLIKNPWMRDQLRPAFKSGADFDHFVEAVTTESQMFGTRQGVLGGSQTAARTAEDATSDNPFLEGTAILGQLAKGHVWSATKNAYQMWRDLGMRPNPELNQKVAQILFTQDLPENVGNALKTGQAPPVKGAYDQAAKRVSGAGQGLAPTLAVDATKERPKPLRVTVHPKNSNVVPDPADQVQ